eukprot:1104531-Rhodomonas_salina.1
MTWLVMSVAEITGCFVAGDMDTLISLSQIRLPKASNSSSLYGRLRGSATASGPPASISAASTAGARSLIDPSPGSSCVFSYFLITRRTSSTSPTSHRSAAGRTSSWQSPGSSVLLDGSSVDFTALQPCGNMERSTGSRRMHAALLLNNMSTGVAHTASAPPVSRALTVLAGSVGSRSTTRAILAAAVIP